MTTKEYVCICGDVFNNPQKFNGHKSHCKQHQNNKHGSLDVYNIRKLETSTKCKSFWDSYKNDALVQWINEKHVCEKCGKVMTEKFGSGRFCSRSCANSRDHSETTKERISTGVKKCNTNTRKESYIQKYQANPKLCKECALALPYNKRYNTFCNKHCQDAYHSKYMLQLCSTMPHSLCGVGKRGWYKGYMCQSSWELAFVIFHIEHNIKFIRNSKGFSYTWEDDEKTYFPDFYLPDSDTYVEVKGYLDSKSIEKIKQFPCNLVIYGKAEMMDILNYVETNYGKDFTYLYDNNTQ